jgi:hypothetical protein
MVVAVRHLDNSLRYQPLVAAVGDIDRIILRGMMLPDRCGLDGNRNQRATCVVFGK